MSKNNPFAGFTLIEIMVVVIIIGILTAIAIPTYTNTKEKTLDKEAMAVLNLVRVANKQYFSNFEYYFPNVSTPITNISLINTNLSLALNNKSWSYSMGGDGAEFTINASRGGRTWTINKTAPTATCSGTCL